jgi:hypothetical protein
MAFQYFLKSVEIDGDKPTFNPTKTECTISLKITAGIVGEQNDFDRTSYNIPMMVSTSLTIVQTLQQAQVFAANYIAETFPNS